MVSTGRRRSIVVMTLAVIMERGSHHAGGTGHHGECEKETAHKANFSPVRLL